MRATAIELEVEALINTKELGELVERHLRGLLKFSDDEIKRKIAFVLSYSKNQKEFLAIRQNPKGVYFGNADEIKFIINSEFYSILRQNKSYGDRFYCGAGKLIIRVRDSARGERVI